MFRLLQEDAKGSFFRKIVFLPFVENTVDMLQNHSGRQAFFQAIGTVPQGGIDLGWDRLASDLRGDRREQDKNGSQQDQGGPNRRLSIAERKQRPPGIKLLFHKPLLNGINLSLCPLTSEMQTLVFFLISS